MCHLFSLNFAGPSFDTITRECRKGVRFIQGEHSSIFKAIADIYSAAKFAHGITSPIPVILAEDETKVKGRISWDARGDNLAGFCGPKADHTCISEYKVIVGEGYEGYTKIVESFRNDKVGAFARAIVVNPLHEKLPRLVLVVCCTCGCFDSNWVRRQWNRIDALWMEDCYAAVGPIIGHASNGDSRRRQLMLEDYKTLSGHRLTADWEGWVFSSQLNAKGEAVGLHDQDYIHNGKKLLNPIDSNVRTLRLGGDLALHQHICQVFNRYTFDEHGLLQEDYERNDRQNWASAQRLCSTKVRDCLRRLRSAEDVHMERTVATEMYLEICADYIDIFLSPRDDLVARIVKAAKVSFFFRIWKLWIKYGNHGILGDSERVNSNVHFISQQCFIDVQLSCHFVVLLILHFRDNYPNLVVPLHLTGSDSCEIFFSQIGGMNGMERAYDFHELVSCANTLNHLSQIEYGENGMKFGRTHNKMNNIWAKMHQLQENESAANLGDYSAVHSNEEVVSALKEGLKDAQQMLNSLNMAPNSHALASKKVLFEKPWMVERADKQSFAYTPTSKPIHGEDGDMEVLRSDLQEVEHELERRIASENLHPSICEHVEEEIVDDGADSMIVVDTETRDAISEMLDFHEEHVGASSVDTKVIPIVQFNGHSIYKSTFVGQLNDNPFLSKDRLTRVKNSMYFNNSEAYLSAAESSSACLVGIGSDVGVYFVQRSTISRTSVVKAVKKRGNGRQSKAGSPSSVLQGVDEGSWWIGRIQKIRRRVGGTKWGSLKQPIHLLKREPQTGKKSSPLANVQCIMHYYSRALGVSKFRYNHTDSCWIDIECLITNVTLTYNADTKIYTLDPEDADNLNEYVANKR